MDDARQPIEYIPAKTIVTRNKDDSWFGADYTMNLYKGCQHGCIYCDSRSECYRIEDFDRVRAKENALQVEPYAPPSSERFDAVARLSERGIFTGILMMPVLPMIEDDEENVLGIARKAKECGAQFVYPTFGMTLRANQRIHYYEKLDEAFPGLREKYEKAYGGRYDCRSANAKKLYEAFAKECDKLGLYYTMGQITMAYKRGYESKQMSLFDFI